MSPSSDLHAMLTVPARQVIPPGALGPKHDSMTNPSGSTVSTSVDKGFVFCYHHLQARVHAVVFSGSLMLLISTPAAL